LKGRSVGAGDLLLRTVPQPIAGLSTEALLFADEFLRRVNAVMAASRRGRGWSAGCGTGGASVKQ
jgi:hypothetical protein